MSYAYAQKKREAAQTTAAPQHSGGAMENSIPNSVRLAMLEAGQISPTAADKGHRVDLPEAMRAKMENSFGMDFSAVKLYESAMLGQTGAEAMAQGNEIAFAPGKLDFSSMEGQARLGHELSHVASQARGEVHGNGFLLDSGLEARADREGAMAARGESVYGNDYGGAVAPLSSASPASMDGPMQAKSGDKKLDKARKRNNERLEQALRAGTMQEGDKNYGKMMEARTNFIMDAAQGFGEGSAGEALDNAFKNNDITAEGGISRGKDLYKMLFEARMRNARKDFDRDNKY
ncbi:MAG: DUF4157 domain-containing protein [Oscillibacter sp.]|nr:DUF4157 domain-containing protein [Oscillibacter sp.]